MNYIEFNGKKIHFVRKNGTYWIIVKSVCEALNVDYKSQHKTIREDEILVSASCVQTTQIYSDDQKREYFCISEEYVYGWILQIRSESKVLREYKKECYHVLYNHFHGTFTKQSKLYRETSKEKRKIVEFENKLYEIPGYQEYMESKMRIARLWKQAKEAASGNGLFDDE